MDFGFYLSIFQKCKGFKDVSEVILINEQNSIAYVFKRIANIALIPIQRKILSKLRRGHHPFPLRSNGWNSYFK